GTGIIGAEPAWSRLRFDRRDVLRHAAVSSGTVGQSGSQAVGGSEGGCALDVGAVRTILPGAGFVGLGLRPCLILSRAACFVDAGSPFDADYMWGGNLKGALLPVQPVKISVVGEMRDHTLVRAFRGTHQKVSAILGESIDVAGCILEVPAQIARFCIDGEHA